MKKFTLILMFSLFLFSCSENSVTNPENPAKQLLKLPSSIAKSNGETEFLRSKEINGVNGDTINFSFPYESISGKTVTISGVLEIPKGAFDYSTTFILEVDKEEAVIKFSPSPSFFDKALRLNLFYEGLNLNPIEEEDVDFYYINEKEKTLEPIESKIKIFEKDKGELGIIEAEIWHFSRFGWYI